jgi:hypothetical protein
VATLIRPSTHSEKELILHITPARGELFSRAELISLIGVDYFPIELLSGDILLVQKCCEEKTLGKNSLASILSKRDIYGAAILTEPKEVD